MAYSTGLLKKRENPPLRIVDSLGIMLHTAPGTNSYALKHLGAPKLEAFLKAEINAQMFSRTSCTTSLFIPAGLRKEVKLTHP
jgi:hypothetical protein